jgi:hypothetical protein
MARAKHRVGLRPLGETQVLAGLKWFGSRIPLLWRDGRPLQPGFEPASLTDQSAVRIRNLDDPIERLWRAGKLSESEFRAAESFRRDWELIQLRGLVPALDRTRGGAPIGLTDIQVRAMQRFKEAIRSLGPINAQILQAVLCDRVSPTLVARRSELARSLHWTKDNAVARLREILEQLSRHYQKARSDCSRE